MTEVSGRRGYRTSVVMVPLSWCSGVPRLPPWVGKTRDPSSSFPKQLELVLQSQSLPSQGREVVAHLTLGADKRATLPHQNGSWSQTSSESRAETLWGWEAPPTPLLHPHPSHPSSSPPPCPSRALPLTVGMVAIALLWQCQFWLLGAPDNSPSFTSVATLTLHKTFVR